jgi:hypothetical protein
MTGFAGTASVTRAARALRQSPIRGARPARATLRAVLAIAMNTTNAPGRDREPSWGLDLEGVDVIGGVSVFDDFDVLGSAWTAKDPIGFNGGTTNLYEYVGGDPVNLIDATGQVSVLAVVGVGALAVVAGTAIYSLVVNVACPGWHMDRNRSQTGRCPETRDQCKEDDFYTFQEEAKLHCNEADVRGRGDNLGVQCVYGTSGALDSRQECAGTYDYVAPKSDNPLETPFRLVGHLFADVIPYAGCGNGPVYP